MIVLLNGYCCLSVSCRQRLLAMRQYAFERLHATVVVVGDGLQTVLLVCGETGGSRT